MSTFAGIAGFLPILLVSRGTPTVKNIRSKKFAFTVLVLFILVLIGIFYMQVRDNSQYFLGSGNLYSGTNRQMISAINAYMEKNLIDSYLDAAIKNNYHCASTLYGFDDEYMYSWVICEGYKGTERNLSVEYGFSSPFRFKYINPDFTITQALQPGDAGSNPTLQSLFPKRMYEKASSGNAESDRLEKEAKQKALRNRKN